MADEAQPQPQYWEVGNLPDGIGQTPMTIPGTGGYTAMADWEKTGMAAQKVAVLDRTLYIQRVIDQDGIPTAALQLLIRGTPAQRISTTSIGSVVQSLTETERGIEELVRELFSHKGDDDRIIEVATYSPHSQLPARRTIIGIGPEDGMVTALDTFHGSLALFRVGRQPLTVDQTPDIL